MQTRAFISQAILYLSPLPDTRRTNQDFTALLHLAAPHSSLRRHTLYRIADDYVQLCSLANNHNNPSPLSLLSSTLAGPCASTNPHATFVERARNSSAPELPYVRGAYLPFSAIVRALAYRTPKCSQAWIETRAVADDN